MAVSRIQDEVLQCTICYETFKTPKSLPCLHTFCEYCLSGYIRGIADVKKKLGFSCPVCREFVKAPDHAKPPSAWAAMFKTNFHMNKLKEALGDEQVSDNPKRNACAEHPLEEIDLFCVACNDPICHLCSGISHRGCDLVLTLKEASDDRRVNLLRISEQMDSTLNRSREEVAEAKKYLDSLSSMKEVCKNDVKTFTHALIDAIRQREDILLNEIDEKHERMRDRADLKIDNFRENQKSYHQTLVQITELASRGVPFDVLKCYDKFRNSSTLDLTPLITLNEQIKRADITFVSGVSVAKLSRMLKRMGSIVLDEVKPEVRKSRAASLPTPGRTKQRPNIKPGTSTQAIVAEEKDVVVDIAAKTVKLHTVPRKRTGSTRTSPDSCNVPTATLVKTFSGRHRDDDLPPKLVDVIVMCPSKETGDILLVTDWSNQCVKAFHNRRDRDSRLHLGGKPWCITALSATAVAVSLPLSQQICVLKVGSSMTLLSSVLAQKRYSGLAALDKDTMAASGGGCPPSVDIINISGEVLRSFSHDGSNSPLFAYPSYVCTTPGGHILVSDRDEGTLTCLGRDGTVVWCFRPQGARELVNPAGVFCNSRGKVLFVEERGVLGLSAEGLYVGVVLGREDGVEAPRGVWAGESGKIYLTSKEGDISVFRLK